MKKLVNTVVHLIMYVIIKDYFACTTITIAKSPVLYTFNFEMYFWCFEFLCI